MSDSPITDYLAQLRRLLPWYLPRRRRFLAEVADHLDQAAAGERASGAGEQEAEQRAVDRLGPAEEMSAELRAGPRSALTARRVGALVGVGALLIVGAIALRSSAEAPASRSATPAPINVSYIVPRPTTTVIAGGTPQLRARARSVLDRMGRTDIVGIEFATNNGVPQCRYVCETGTLPDGPGTPLGSPTPMTTTWRPRALIITIAWPGSRQSLIDTTDSTPFWQASLFEAAFFDHPVAGAARITELAIQVRYPSGATQIWMGGALSISHHREPTAPSSAHQIIQQIESAANRSHLQIVHLTLLRPSRFAATVVLHTAGRHDFARDLADFAGHTASISAGLQGFRWIITATGCKSFVADNWQVWSAGSEHAYADPHWACPDPVAFGLGGAPAEFWCRKQLAQPQLC